MPTYDYVCTKCGHVLDAYHPMSYRLEICPECKTKGLIRMVGTGSSFELKGDGFYKPGRV